MRSFIIIKSLSSLSRNPHSASIRRAPTNPPTYGRSERNCLAELGWEGCPMVILLNRCVWERGKKDLQTRVQDARVRWSCARWSMMRSVSSGGTCMMSVSVRLLRQVVVRRIFREDIPHRSGRQAQPIRAHALTHFT